MMILIVNEVKEYFTLMVWPVKVPSWLEVWPKTRSNGGLQQASPPSAQLPELYLDIGGYTFSASYPDL
jgi:hypothetical protein